MSTEVHSAFCENPQKIETDDTALIVENGCGDADKLTNGDQSEDFVVVQEVESISEKSNMQLTASQEDGVGVTLSTDQVDMCGDSNKIVYVDNMSNSNCAQNEELRNEMGTDIDAIVEKVEGEETVTMEMAPEDEMTSSLNDVSHVTSQSDYQMVDVGYQAIDPNASAGILAENQMTFTPIPGQGAVMVPCQGNTVPTMPTSQLPYSNIGPTIPHPPNTPCPQHSHPAAPTGVGGTAATMPTQTNSQTTPPPSGGNTPSPNTCTGSNSTTPHTHVVLIHIAQGETFTVQVDGQIQHIPGPATVRMVSNNGPPMAMPMQVPPGHMVHQIVDENGILTHVILSPQPPGMLGNPLTSGPNNGPGYYPHQYGGPYTNHPQYHSPHHHHSGAPNPGPRGAQPHLPHSTPPPTTCNNHGGAPVHSQGPSPPLNSMDDRVNRQRNRMRKKHQIRESEGYYNRDRGPPRRIKNKGMDANQGGTNGVDSGHSNSITSMSHSTEDHSELEEERRIIQSHLSSMPSPKVTDIDSHSALIQLSPPDCDIKDYEIDPSEFCYELMLSEKGRDGKYKLVYSGDATEIKLKDLKPATEYHLKVCTILDDLKGSPTEAISFKTAPCEPDQPQSPKLIQKTKTSISLKWNAPCENGSKISAYSLEYETREGTGNFVEVYSGLTKQYRVSKLVAASRYSFRLAAINGIGKSDYSKVVTYCTSGSAPSQPDPPMLSECYVTELVVSWIKRPNDDEFLLQVDDETSGHGFINVYAGPLLSHRLRNLRRNKVYKFRLMAKNDEGPSKWSDIVAYNTQPAQPDTPGKPQIKGKIHAHVFRITWDPPKDSGGAEITSYIVELDDGKGYETMYEGMDREHTCDRLTPGHTYKVRVAASSIGGRSEFSEACVATTQPVPPGQCLTPKLQGKPKATSLHLRWAYPDYNGGAQVTEFSAQMISPDNTSREVYKGRDLDCIVAGLSPGRPYLFQVRAFNRAGGGPWSEPLEVVSGAGVPDPPKMPVCQSRLAHSAIITWEEPVNNGATITDYRLEWQSKVDLDFTQLYYGPNVTYEVKGLSPATVYTFRVQAINSAGAGLYSPISTCLTPPSSPSSVVSIRASSSAKSVTLTWKEPHDNGSDIYAYNIDLGEKQLITVSAVEEYTIEDLTPETTYKVRIQAVNGIGVGSFSSPVKFTTRALPPNPPRLECCGQGHNSIKLKWGDGRNADLITFTLEMARDDGNFQEVYKGQAFSCKVNRLTELNSYDFRIYACNDAGSGPFSDVSTFSTTKAPPPALRAPKVEDVQLTSCHVRWEECRPLGEDQILYLLQLQSREHEYRQVYKGVKTSYNLDNLQCKTDYHVRVCAIRMSPSDESELVGAFSPGTGFQTASPEPVKPVLSLVTESKMAEPRQLSDQQLTAIIVLGLMVIAVLFAFVVQQFISYTSGTTGRDSV